MSHLAIVFLASLLGVASAAVFDGSATLATGQDTSSALTVPGSNALTVMCWAKLSVPSSVALSDSMTLMINRRSGTGAYAWRLFWNSATGNLEFDARDASGSIANAVLVERPYLDRWYHLAAVRSGSRISVYVDGRLIRTVDLPAGFGSSSNQEGASFGGEGATPSQPFYGEIQEVGFYQRALSRADIALNAFRDLPADAQLKGYYKLGPAAAEADSLKNYAPDATNPAPAAGTSPLTKQGAGTVTFPLTDRGGEQSIFDSRRNGGADAMSPVAGTFAWAHQVFTRPTPGVPFDFTLHYNSGMAYQGSEFLEGSSLFEDATLGSGWRHGYELKIVPLSQSAAGAPTASTLAVIQADGGMETWGITAGVYRTRHGEYRGELRRFTNPETGEAYIDWITPSRIIYRFYHPVDVGLDQAPLAGLLAEIRDFWGNRTVINREPSYGRITSVVDSGGGEWRFTYDIANPRLTRVELFLPPASGGVAVATGWAATFAYDGARLISKTLLGPAGYALPVKDDRQPGGSVTWSFAYDGLGRVATITNPRNRFEVRVQYDGFGRKFRELYPNDSVQSWEYSVVPAATTGTRSITRRDQANKAWIETFDRKGRVTEKRDPLGNISKFSYDAAGNVLTSVEPKGSVSGATASEWTSNFTYDARSNMLSKTDAYGRVWTWEYTASIPALDGHSPSSALALNSPSKETRPATTEAPSGWSGYYTYNASTGALLKHEDDLPGPGGATRSTLASHTYDTNGLVHTSTDALGTATTFSYTTAGFQQSKSVPHQSGPLEASVPAVWSYDTNELGWVTRETNPLSESMTYTHDVNGKVIDAQDHIGRHFVKKHDGNGNLAEERDGKGVATIHVYDSVDRKESTTDRAGSRWDFTYEPRGLLVRTESPKPQPSAPETPDNQRFSSWKEYDDAGQLTQETDHAGQNTRYEYDANGNRTARVDRLGNRYETVFDRLDRVVEQRVPRPAGSPTSWLITKTTYDAAGRVDTLTTPEGYVTRHSYDGRGRLVSWTDAEGSTWTYTYDPAGNILDIEDALLGHYAMTYGPRGERWTEVNQDNQTWSYTYDALLRLASQRNPAPVGVSGLLRTWFYDAVGRVRKIDYSTGREDFRTYDANNNPTNLKRCDADGTITDVNFTSYDALDRPLSVADTFGQAVGYEYDRLGRAITLIYPGNRRLAQAFDSLSRLVRQQDWLGNVGTYQWDTEGRLTGRSYPNGVIQALSYDSAGRLTQLDYRDDRGTSATADDTTLIALRYAYDRNGNQTSATEKGLYRWQQPARLPNETQTFTAAGKLISRQDSSDASGASNWSFTYAPDGTLREAISPNESLALSYDEDHRTTNITRTLSGHATPDTSIGSRYDALGRRISRSINGTQTRYVLNLVGGMERILADTNASGLPSAFYIHGPDLAWKIDAATGAITCYHADASGNIIRLTGPRANSTAPQPTVQEYAYTPYGRLLGSRNPIASDANPYRFVGSQGVMEELPGLYFMRARYYSADAAVFLTNDPLRGVGPNWTSNAYLYAAGNPSSFWDPNGKAYVSIGLAEVEAGVAIGPVGASVSGSSSVKIDGNRDVGLEFAAQAQGEVGLGGGAHASLIEFGTGYVEPGGNGEGYYGVEACLFLLAGGCIGHGSEGFKLQLGLGLEAGITGFGGVQASYTFSGKEKPSTSTSNGKTNQQTSLNNDRPLRTNESSKSSSSVATPIKSASILNSKQATGTKTASYTIKPGDTLSSIATRNGTTVAAIAATNGIKNVHLIRAGGKLTIPVSSNSGNRTSSSKASSTSRKR